VRGDLNGDGVVNAADAALALAFGTSNRKPTAQELAAGDVNGDGAINAADAAILLYYATFQAWPPVERPLLHAEAVAVVPATVPGRRGQIVSLPIRVSQGSTVAGAGFEVIPGDGLTFVDMQVAEPLREGEYRYAVEQTAAGTLRVSLAVAEEMDVGEQTLVVMRFAVAEDVAADTQMIPVEVGGVWLNDREGRDFSVSALGREVRGGTGGVDLTAEPVGPGTSGDCNGDDQVDAGDLTALVLRLFEGQFAENEHCNANGDDLVDAGDISCTTLLIFNGPGACEETE
jgi:hypothetical protein